MAAPLGNKNARKTSGAKSAHIVGFRAFPDCASTAKRQAKALGVTVGDYLIVCMIAHNTGASLALALAKYKKERLGKE